ncbi:hypothetical protein GCM10022213_24570 [Parerythrobacter jejuensis]
MPGSWLGKAGVAAPRRYDRQAMVRAKPVQCCVTDCDRTASIARFYMRVLAEHWLQTEKRM